MSTGRPNAAIRSGYEKTKADIESWASTTTSNPARAVSRRMTPATSSLWPRTSPAFNNSNARSTVAQATLTFFRARSAVSSRSERVFSTVGPCVATARIRVPVCTAFSIMGSSICTTGTSRCPAAARTASRTAAWARFMVEQVMMIASTGCRRRRSTAVRANSSMFAGGGTGSPRWWAAMKLSCTASLPAFTSLTPGSSRRANHVDHRVIHEEPLMIPSARPWSPGSSARAWASEATPVTFKYASKRARGSMSEASLTAGGTGGARAALPLSRSRDRRSSRTGRAGRSRARYG